VTSTMPAAHRRSLSLPFARQGRLVGSGPIVESIAVCNYLPSRQHSVIGSHHRRNGKA
jgi:hypothetical protein